MMALFVVSLVALTALSVRQAVREIHEEVVARRVAEITAEAAMKMPAAWEELLAGTADIGLPQQEQLARVFTEAVSERGLLRLKVYDRTGETLYSTAPQDIGQVEDNEALTAAIAQGLRTLLPHKEADGSLYNEFYVPVERPDGTVGLVMELYEPAGALRAILARALVVPTLVPGTLLVGLLFVLGFLIRRAQASIDLRAARVRELSTLLESFVSSSAVGAVRAAHGGDVPLKRIEVSLLYSDVRRFTDFSETRPPEEVVAFLNRIMTIEIECVTRHGGDVDKLIGDALLARFEREEKEKRAIAAALDIQTSVEQAGLPRGVGIGVYTGPAISGPIGPEARRDYTVIGDSVNIAARLSDEAQHGEIVADAETLERSCASDRFGADEDVTVKGREQPIAIRRWPRAGG
jgi:class 3 adenylate cyclase